MPRWSPFIPYFWSLVKKTDTCWVWQGDMSKGYGRIWRGKRRYAAHRVAYELAHGEIPGGLLVCHHCDNKPCVRPSHLFAGTHKGNMQDWTKKGLNKALENGTLTKYGDDNWMRKPRSKDFRKRLSKKLKYDIKIGARLVLKDKKTGRIIGTKVAA